MRRRRCVRFCGLLFAVLLLTGVASVAPATETPPGVDGEPKSMETPKAVESQDVLKVSTANGKTEDLLIPSTKPAIQERIKEIQQEIDSIIEKKEQILEGEEIKEDDLRRVLVALGALQNVYSRYTSAIDSLEDAKRGDAEHGEKAAAPVISGQPPFNLSFYEEVRNRFEAVAQRLNSVVSSIRLAEGSSSALDENTQRMETQHKTLLEELLRSDTASLAGKAFQLKEVEADLEASTVSRRARDLNVEAQTILRAILQDELVELQKGLEFVKKHLAFDEEDRIAYIESLGERISAEREKLVELRNERERLRAVLARSQGALTSARNEKERILAQAGVAEQQAALQLAQISLEQLEQSLFFWEESQKIWDARYALLNDSLKGQALWDLRSKVLARVKDLESVFLLRQGSLSAIQADILAAQKEIEEHTGTTAVLARIRSRIGLLSKTIEMNNTAVAHVFDIFNKYSRLREEINEQIDTVRIAERVTTFGKERFFAFWNITLWSGDGFDLTVAKLVFAVLLFLAAFFLSGRLTMFLSRVLLTRLGMDLSAIMATQKILFFVLMGAFILAALDLVGIPLTAFAFLGGALVIGIGFGAQNIFNNLISGFILMFSKPMRVADIIDIDGLLATVEEIGTRATKIKTFDNIDVLVPNSYFLNNKIVNWTLTDQKIRLRINLGVRYGADARKVEELLLLAARDHTRILRAPEPYAIFGEFGPSALEFTLFFWIDMATASSLKVASDLRFRLVSLFEKNGIEFAFPRMDVHLDSRTPVELRPSLPRRDTENPTAQEE